MIDSSWEGLPEPERRRILSIKKIEFQRKRQERRGIEITLELLEREIRKLDVEINNIRASLGEAPSNDDFY